MLRGILPCVVVVISVAASAPAQTRPASEPGVDLARVDTSQTDAGGEGEWLKRQVQLAVNGDEATQFAALNEIANSKQSSPSAAAAIRKLLNVDSGLVSRAAVHALMSMGSVASPQWLEALKSKDGVVRQYALDAFADPHIRLEGDDLLTARTAIENLLHDEWSLTRRKAARALARFWPDSAPALTDAIRSGDKGVQWEVYHLVLDEKFPLLAEAGPEDVQSGRRLFIHKADPKAMVEFGNLFAHDLLELMRLPDGDTRRHAFAAINALPPECAAERLAANYEQQMRGDDEQLRRDAAYSLALMGPVATPRLIVGSDSDDEFVRGFCIDGLCQRTNAASDQGVINIICAAMLFEGDKTRQATLLWAYHLDKPPPRLLDCLVFGLTTDGPHGFRDVVQRVSAISVLGKFATEPRRCIPVLMVVLGGDSSAARIAALQALRSFGAEAGPAFAQIRKLLDSGDDALSAHAASTLMALSPADHKILTAYYARQVSRRDADDQRHDAVAALASLGADAADATPELIAVLSEDDNALRIEVARALGAIGPAARPAIPALLRMVDNHQVDVRQAATDALLRIAPDGRGITGAVMAAVENGDAENAARLAAAVQHGDDAGALVHRLDEFADDPDARVRRAAKHAAQWLAPTPEKRK